MLAVIVANSRSSLPELTTERASLHTAAAYKSSGTVKGPSAAMGNR